MFFSTIFPELKASISNNLTSRFQIDCLIDLNQINLDNKINKIIAISNFDNLLSLYGLNSNSTHKLWNKFLLLIMCFGFLKHLIISQLDPVKDFHYCLILGDFTLLFKSFRKSFNFVLILIFSYGINIISMICY